MAPSTLDQEELLKSGLFDPQWYLDRNTDVQILGMDPLEHFLWLGSRLNRSPGPKFDSERYLQVNVDVARTDYNPVLHYIRYGKKEGRQAFEVSETSGDLHRRHDSGPRRTTGDVPYRPGRPTVLLCSHVAGETLFGGERSLLDMLGGLDALDFNVIVTVPGTGNAAYFEVLKSEAHAVYTLSYGWWRKGQPINEKLVAHFAHIMSENAVDVVHTNTIVLREPLIAARRMGLRSLVHARELIRHDQALLNMIGEPAESIVEQVWDNADQVIANSRATQDGFALDGRTPALVYNTADLDALSRLPAPAQDRALRVGLISSNIPKKGIWDFAQVAKTVSQTHPEMLFHLIGPENTHTADIDQQVAAGTLPKSLRVLGYRDTPAEAIAETDVVLSLSQFQESFGRTVLEGMAAARLSKSAGGAPVPAPPWSTITGRRPNSSVTARPAMWCLWAISTRLRTPCASWPTTPMRCARWAGAPRRMSLHGLGRRPISRRCARSTNRCWTPPPRRRARSPCQRVCRWTRCRAAR